MNFVLEKENVLTGDLQIILEETALSGVLKIAEIVSKDIEMVVGAKPSVSKESRLEAKMLDDKIAVATLGTDVCIEKIASEAGIKTDVISGKRESYIFKVANLGDNNKATLFIIGSDKRGTIYGLFHLSELMGVSPLVNWNNVCPVNKGLVNITSNDDVISKEPSVKYRGFFINDEWPAFGNWCNEHFGGFTAKCYEQVFELLLRLKGNYMWPAMWSAVFSEDGPGLENAILADELGVVMGMSHHEPCLRNGEEYSHVRGKDSIYGDAWNFRTNEEGITRFWEDGLKRNGSFENVVTVGMRGEADSTIMGKDATLKDNIDLLRDVLKCQNRLIKENVNEDLDSVPRMLALYKEVEPFYYGDENTEGLMTSPELDGVTLMLCDDNFGNLRTIPTKKMLEHKGGFGMYYHFDYHGWPVSYEWVNSSYLPKVWEQMTYAYEAGIRELWIVNVGDIFSTEYPLSFFLDLAYDYDKWGISNPKAPVEYTDKWSEAQFGTQVDKENLSKISDMLMAYTKLAYTRRPEATNDRMYKGQDGIKRAFDDMAFCKEYMSKCEALSAIMPDEVAFPYFQFVYYPLMGNLNVRKMWAACAINHYLTEFGASEAKKYADCVNECLTFDENLTERLHTVNNGRWYGMGMSEHIGFANWNEEECRYPVVYGFKPANKKRIVAVVDDTCMHTEGGDWTKRTLKVPVGNPSTITVYSCSAQDVEITVNNISDGIIITDENGEAINSDSKLKVLAVDHITLTVDVAEKNNKQFTGSFMIVSEIGAHIPLEVSLVDITNICIDAKDYVSKEDAKGTDAKASSSQGSYEYVNGIGIKAFPVAKSFGENEGPSVTYEFDVPVAGEYKIDIYMTPGNPPYMDQRLLYGLNINDEVNITKNAVPEGFRIGDDQDGWMLGVLENRRINTVNATLNKGKNTVKFTAISPNVTLCKLQISLGE